MKHSAREHFETAAQDILAGRREPALLQLQAGLVLDPTNGAGWVNRGSVLYEMGNPFEALVSYDLALHHGFETSGVHANRGAALLTLEQHERADKAFSKALALNPDDVYALSNKASLRYLRGDYDEADYYYTRVLEIPSLSKPLLHEMHTNRACVNLARGRFKEGWEEYEWRKSWLTDARKWTGGPYKSIMVVCEQGFGDHLQFMRLASLLKHKHGGKVYLEMRAPLLRLAKTMPGIDGVVAFRDKWPEVDAVVSAMSLPHLLDINTEEDIPSAPYLFADGSTWDKKLPRGFRVGLCWAGQARADFHNAEIDRRRSMTLVQMASLAHVPGVQFISLQVGQEWAQVLAPPGMRVQDVSSDIEDYKDTADLMMALDLIITVDTSVVHLAGALGRPVWLLSRFDTCWRWMGDRKDSPWYPTLRQFKQPKWGDWGSVIMDVARALNEKVRLKQVA